MSAIDIPVRTLLAALQEPAIIVAGTSVEVANEPARQLLGPTIEGRDVRLAIRHPEALHEILGGRDADVDLAGIGRIDQPWGLRVRRLGDKTVLVQLFDRSEIVSAERMRVDFVANASHELRTPLATITGYAETLAEGGALPDELRRNFASVMLDEAKRMAHLIEDLMSLSRIQADRFTVPTSPISVEQVVRAAVGNVGPLREAASCTIETDVPSDLPSIRGDSPQLVQVIDNLLSNAIRYGCSVKGASVSLVVRNTRSWVTITIRDQGPGIARDHLPRVTERFYRVDAARSRHSGGTGLGLAIVKHIVERHRGRLEIKSELGSGTAVTVSLPADA